MEQNHSLENKGYLEYLELELDRLLLSPNKNYWRNNKAEYVSDEKLQNPIFQAELLNVIATANTDLIDVIIKNGFAEYKEEIYVKEIKGTKFYKVTNGNKRVAALKKLKQDAELGKDIGVLNIHFFDKISVLIFTEEQEEFTKKSFNQYTDAVRKILFGEDKKQTFKLSFSTNVKSLEKKAKTHFKNLNIKNFKAFQKGLNIGDFKQVNIIAGENNVGKTSFLEAVYLLANLNNTKGVFSICQTRGKLTNGINGETLERLMPNEFQIEGVFDNNNYDIKLEKFNSKNTDLDRSNYRTSYKLLAKAKKEKLETTVNIFNTKQPEFFYTEEYQICPSVFSSPFSFLDKQLLEQYHDNAVEKGIFFDIINFINTHIDDNFLSINKVGKGNLVRFIVNHKKLGAIDLTEFGDGVQRIFYVGLMMASAENGVICIDEIENAIHYKLLVKFTNFIQILAEKLNIQVFATTHSNECIKAFFENEYKNEEVAGFRFTNKDGKIHYATASGVQFQTLLEKFSFDLRG